MAHARSIPGGRRRLPTHSWAASKKPEAGRGRHLGQLLRLVSPRSFSSMSANTKSLPLGNISATSLRSGEHLQISGVGGTFDIHGPDALAGSKIEDLLRIMDRSSEERILSIRVQYESQQMTRNRSAGQRRKAMASPRFAYPASYDSNIWSSEGMLFESDKP
jgi:hypothetical protein